MPKAIVTASGDSAFQNGEQIGSFATESKSVEYWNYDADRKELVIQYKSSTAFYIYESVPFSTLFGLLTAESIGSFVAKEVKPNYEFRKVGG